MGPLNSIKKKHTYWEDFATDIIYTNKILKIFHDIIVPFVAHYAMFDGFVFILVWNNWI